MSRLDKPTMQMPIGRATVGGQEVPVYFSPEFFRQWVGSFDRLGGVFGTGTNDLSASAFEDAGIAEQLWMIQQLGDAGRQSPPLIQASEVQALQTQVAEMQAQIDKLNRAIAGLSQEPA